MKHTSVLCRLLCGLMLFPFLACREEGLDSDVVMPLTDIVTYTGNRDGHAEFTLIKVDDTPELLLTADAPLNVDSERVPGRMLITYIPESGRPYESGPIKLLGASLINFAPVRTEWRDEYDRWDADGVYLYSMWRSGTYVNLHVRLTYSTDPRLFCLVADPSTLEQPVPDLYLVHALQKPVDNHDRAYYASFDLSPVWNSPSVEGVRIHVANTNLDKHIFTFTKNGASGNDAN
ncbi:MAG: hypothetical protein K2I12_07735 [Duncaniella sp.]|nr:hypothetical protein [Duncaniella sp.]